MYQIGFLSLVYVIDVNVIALTRAGSSTVPVPTRMH